MGNTLHAHRLPWTPEEEHTMLDLIEAGHGYQELAARLGRTIPAIQHRLMRHGSTLWKSKASLSASDAARLLGFAAQSTIVEWHTKHKWLRMKNAGGTTRTHWRILWPDFLTFLASPAYWFAWQPSTITDRELRLWAQELRATQPAWLTTAEVARRYHVTYHAVVRWIQMGLLPATRYNKWYIWEPDLNGFVPPSQGYTGPLHVRPSSVSPLALIANEQETRQTRSRRPSLRVRIMAHLERGPLTVGQLCALLDINKRNVVSVCLNLLKKEGRVARGEERQWYASGGTND